MIETGKEVQVWLQPELGEIPSAGFTGILDHWEERGISIHRATDLGRYQTVFIPWTAIRYVVQEKEGRR